MNIRRISIVAPGSGSGQAKLHTLQNGIIRAKLYSSLFGKSGQIGYLSPLGLSTHNLDFGVKMQTALFSLVETFSLQDNRLTSILRQAAEALRIEVFEQPWTEKHLFNGEHIEAFNWKTTAKTIPEFIRDCEVVLGRMQKPLFGGLPKLAVQLVSIARSPNISKQQEEISGFMSAIDPAKPLESMTHLMQILSQDRLVPATIARETTKKFNGLKPVRPIENAAILEAKAYVIGVVVFQTKSVSAYRKNWFDLLGFVQYHTDEIKDLMLKMGFEAEWHSFDLEYKERTAID